MSAAATGLSSFIRTSRIGEGAGLSSSDAVAAFSALYWAVVWGPCFNFPVAILFVGCWHHSSFTPHFAPLGVPVCPPSDAPMCRSFKYPSEVGCWVLDLPIVVD